MDATLEANADQMEELLFEIALGRMVQPEEVATLAVYLAYDATSYVMGSTFVIVGGMMRHAGSL
jgi:NAD(P)-dependent dehydrogenase (short-subunit alcohol dehydrogenase family)